MKKIPVYEVEVGVPIPPVANKTGTVPISHLAVGESLLFAVERRNSVASYASKLKQRRGYEYTIRAVDPEHCRIWRTT
jgi:hypothetical protein